MTGIVLLTIAVLAGWLWWASRLATETAIRRLATGLAIYMFLQPFTEPLAALLFGIHPPEIASLIPVHLCDYSAIILGLTLLRKKPWLLDRKSVV